MFGSIRFQYANSLDRTKKQWYDWESNIDPLHQQHYNISRELKQVEYNKLFYKCG